MIFEKHSSGMSENTPKLHDEDKENQLLIQQRAEMFSGPIPPPELIERYEKILPGAAKTIFSEWESQTMHRQKIERSVIATDNLKSILGLVFGFIVVLVAIAGGIYIALRGKELFGSGLSLAGLALLAGAFITSRKQKEPKE